MQVRHQIQTHWTYVYIEVPIINAMIREKIFLSEISICMAGVWSTIRLVERTNTKLAMVNLKQWKQLCVTNQFKDANENPKGQQGEVKYKASV
jgi:hypothetical protein